MRDGWERVALGDVLRLRSERRHSVTTLLSVTADRGVIRQSESGRRDSSSADKSLYWDVHSGDVVYNTMRMWQGVSGIAGEEGIVSPAYTVCEPVGEVSDRFLGWLLQDPKLVVKFLNRSQGLVSDTWNLKYSEFKKIEIDLPPLSTQRLMAEVLDEVDAQVQRALARRGKMAVVAAAATAELMRSTSEATGVEWTVLEKVADISAGVTLGNDESGDGAVSLPYLRVANVQEGHIDTADIKSVTVRISDVERFRLAKGDVLLTEGGDLDKLGRGGVWDGRIDPCLHQNHVFKVRCQTAVYRPDFLASYLASPRGKSYFLSVAKQTTNLASINSSQVKKAPVPIVPLVEQERVVSSVAEWKSQLANADKDIDKLRLLRSALMDDLLTGKICVPVPA
ncbi:restriction endonuclease subunit S [Streptomyces sp. NPDC087428]|uniref:restriction endonuclease subunit S n=1 Tax=Streptomyces sp. NPDC087428 TaxID=3365788 RepID=UPI0038172BB5